MWKPILVVPAIASFWGSFAYAQPAPQPQPVKLQLVVKTGTDTRTHDIQISDRGCGVVKEKTQSYEDEFKICSTATGNNVSLAVESMIRTNNGPAFTEYRLNVEIAVPRKGGSAEVGRVGNGFRYSLKTM